MNQFFNSVSLSPLYTLLVILLVMLIGTNCFIVVHAQTTQVKLDRLEGKVNRLVAMGMDFCASYGG
jgi:hypothetical protein